MKKILWLFLIATLLVACGNEEEPEVRETEPVENKQQADEPTQEELNEQIKAEAIEVEFVKANAEEYEVGTRLKATGEVSFLDDITFTLTTEEGEGYGMYEIFYANTTEAEFKDGDTVTVYGAYDGKADDSGMPKIGVSIIEPQ